MIGVSIAIEIMQNDFPRLAKALPHLAALAVSKAAADIMAFARTNAPVLTGYLMNSITVEMVAPLLALVSVGALYGVFVEFGTRHMPARPFFLPAIELVRPQFEAAIANAVKGLA